LSRATMASRPHPAPRFGSVHEESVSRVPHFTSCAISARMDFSSTVARAILPVGRGKIFACGFTCAGSAGSRGLVFCASAAIPTNARRSDANTAVLSERLPNLFSCSAIVCIPRVGFTDETGILPRKPDFYGMRRSTPTAALPPDRMSPSQSSAKPSSFGRN